MTPKHAKATDADFERYWDEQRRVLSDRKIANAARRWERGEITAYRLKAIVARESAKREPLTARTGKE